MEGKGRGGKYVNELKSKERTRSESVCEFYSRGKHGASERLEERNGRV